MLKTYDVTCPDENFCGQEFEVVDLDPATEEDCIECPHCGQQFDWEHDPVTDTITLILDESDEEDEGEGDEAEEGEGE